jgi:hypothetical protein
MLNNGDGLRVSGSEYHELSDSQTQLSSSAHNWYSSRARRRQRRVSITTARTLSVMTATAKRINPAAKPTGLRSFTTGA